MFGILFGANATSSTGPIICVMRPRFVSVFVEGVIMKNKFNKNNINSIVNVRHSVLRIKAIECNLKIHRAQ